VLLIALFSYKYTIKQCAKANILSRDFKNIGKDIANQARLIKKLANGNFQKIIGVEGLKHFDKSWDKEGFTDKSLSKWKPREWKKTTHKKKGGQRKDYKRWKAKNKGRKLLMSHRSDTDGGHLRHSISYRVVGTKTIFYTDKPYAKVHNEGGKAGRGIGFVMKKRQFMGHSHQWDQKIEKKLDREMNKIFK
jgi:phage gpG-like protein